MVYFYQLYFMKLVIQNIALRFILFSITFVIHLAENMEKAPEVSEAGSQAR